jgi:hypothetical protein
VYFRRLVAIALALAITLPAAEPPAVERARARLATLRQLFAAGAVSARQVEQAEAAVAQALDDQKIDEAVYGELVLEELTEEQAAAMTAAARRRLAREQARLAEAAKLVSAGVAPRSSLLPYEDSIDRARRTLSSAEERARTVNELIARIHVEQAAEGETEAGPLQGPLQGPMPVVTRFAGGMKFTFASDFKKILLAYEKQFDRKLPVSAKGQTALHRTLGFDHRDRVDIALNPDDPEGRWLTAYLEKAMIPFFAFRSSIRGQATAPHIHIGPPSLRLPSFD